MQSKIIKFKPKGTGGKTPPAPQATNRIATIRKKIHHV
jgi:hypothetical protein